ncbi:MAG: hypothetical protein ACOCPM_03775 [Bacteroidales bacterium]
MEYSEKIKQADTIFQNLADEVTHIMLEINNPEHASPKYLLPWLEEDAEHAIKRLGLNPEDERIYLQRINNLLGEYSDNPPLKKK